jgi:RNA polymerase sigma factor for flagellar operon FliA
VPPGVDKQIRQVTEATAEIAEQTGSTPTDEQLAEKLQISVERLYSIFESARAKHFISIDHPADETVPMSSILPANGTMTPHEHLERSELVDRLADAIQQLDQRQRQIILLYYKQQLTMKQIAEVFEITEPRVSQLHASALMNLSARLGRQNDAKR